MLQDIFCGVAAVVLAVMALHWAITRAERIGAVALSPASCYVHHSNPL